MAKMFIGGESVNSVTKNTTEVRNPATGATVDTVPQGNDKDVQQATQAAEDAFKVWSDVAPEDRGNALLNAGELIKRNAGEIAQLLTQEQGKTLFEAGLEIHHLVHGLEFYAGLASKVRGSHVPLPQKGAYGMVVRQPIGVCGGIVPWNFPLTLMGTKLGPALAAGNTIIIKPASTTPLATIRVIELIAQATFGEGKAQKSLPKGTVTIVTPLGPLRCHHARPLNAGTPMVAGVRPEHVILSAHRPQAWPNVFEGTVVSAQYEGGRVKYRVAMGDLNILAYGPAAFSLGDRLHAVIDPAQVILLPDLPAEAAPSLPSG